MKKTQIKKIEGALSIDELSSVDNMMLNRDQVENLFAKTPEKHKYERKAKGGGTWTYVTGIYVKKKLNFLFGWDWDFLVVDHIINITYPRMKISEGFFKIFRFSEIEFKKIDSLVL